MRGSLLLRTLALAVVGVAGSSGRVSAADPPFPLAMNLASIADYSAEIVFVDSFKISRPWLSQKEKAAFGKGGDLPLDERGWPKNLEPTQFAEALIHVDIQPHYPSGKYVCTFEGNGTLEFSHAAQGRPAVGKKNAYDVDVDSNKSFIALRVRSTDPKNPVKNIRFENVEAKKEAVAKGTMPFNAGFFKRYKGFQAIRFMDWQRTNNSKQVKWAERPRVDDATQAGTKGVALEYCIQLANTLDADPWFCIPHLADDDYVRSFAKLVKEKVNTKHKIYVEYSNETWNTMFDQAKHCKEKGLELKLSENGYEAQLRYSAQRSVEIFKLFEEVFGGKDRLVRVLAVHAANPWTGTTEMDWQDAYKSADAVAIAPYFGNAFGDPKTVAKVSQMTVDEILDGCKKMIADNKVKNQKYADEAKKRNLRLMCYESGQHLAGYAGAENNAKLTDLFHEANRHPRMKELYLEDLKNWQDVGGDTYAVFSSVGRYTKWGSWGVLEHAYQDETKAPKMMALREWMKQGK